MTRRKQRRRVQVALKKINAVFPVIKLLFLLNPIVRENQEERGTMISGQHPTNKGSDNSVTQKQLA
jgi:hypothetical protein